MQAHENWKKISKYGRIHPLKECMIPRTRWKPYKSLYYLVTLLISIPCRLTKPYRDTLSRAIPYLKILNRTIPYLNTMSRTKPYLNTLSWIIAYLKTLSRIYSRIPLSAANKIQVLRHPSRQPFSIECHVIRELSARVEVRSGLSARVGLL